MIFASSSAPRTLRHAVAGVPALTLALTLALLPTASSSAASPSFPRRDDPGPVSTSGLRLWSMRAAPTAPAAPHDVAVTINDRVITHAEYQRMLEAVPDVRAAMSVLPEEERKRFAYGLTPEEIVLVREHAEPWLIEEVLAPQGEELERRAWEMHERALAGEDWWSLIREYSTEPIGNSRQGDMGVVTMRQLVGPYNRIVFSAPLGEPLEPVRTVFGWHVGKVHEILPARDGEPEKRRVSQAVLMYDTVPAVGRRVDLRMVVRDVLRSELDIDVVDRSLCEDLPAICAEDDRQAEAALDSSESGEPLESSESETP